MRPDYSTFSEKGCRLAGLFCVLIALSCAAWSESPDIVGETTLVIGVAKLIHADGSIQSMERGVAIRVGDRIETQAGGHVHIRFVDGGRVSVRPGSRLAIENYAYAGNQSDASAIRFRLDEGVIRSITGAWGEAARDRFRLNTPVAAIGIKGTDFVVKSDLDNTAASVYSGAIMLAPLTAACGATLGPCLNGQEKLLSEDMKGQMLQLSRQQVSPQLVPAIDLMASNRRPMGGDFVTSAHPAADATRLEPGGDKTLVTEARVTNAVSSTSISIGSGEPPVSLGPELSAPASGSLVWGRYLWTQKLATGDISKTYAEANSANWDLVAGSGAYALYREKTPGVDSVMTMDANAVFRLSGSTVYFQRYFDLQIEPASVESGSLSIDFSRAIFSTQLAVSNASIGTDTVRATGTVSSSGQLTPVQSNAAFSGAVTLDGRQAGYLFEKLYASGNLRGITLWGR